MPLKLLDIHAEELVKPADGAETACDEATQAPASNLKAQLPVRAKGKPSKDKTERQRPDKIGPSDHARAALLVDNGVDKHKKLLDIQGYRYKAKCRYCADLRRGFSINYQDPEQPWPRHIRPAILNKGVAAGCPSCQLFLRAIELLAPDFLEDAKTDSRLMDERYLHSDDEGTFSYQPSYLVDWFGHHPLKLDLWGERVIELFVTNRETYKFISLISRF